MDSTKKHPELYERCYDFSPPPGWVDIVDRLSDKLAKDPAVRIVQVKEKYAGLRVYLEDVDQRADDLVRAAEAQAAEVCQECGYGPVKVVSRGGWLRRLCQRHEP